MKVAIITASWYENIINKLVFSAEHSLQQSKYNEFSTIKVPGCWEIPIAVQQILQQGEYSGVIALGCIIRGETPHFSLIADNVFRALMDISLKYNTPVTTGIISANNQTQAIARADETQHSNKGTESAQALINLLDLLHHTKK